MEITKDFIQTVLSEFTQCDYTFLCEVAIFRKQWKGATTDVTAFRYNLKGLSNQYAVRKEMPIGAIASKLGDIIFEVPYIEGVPLLDRLATHRVARIDFLEWLLSSDLI